MLKTTNGRKNKNMTKKDFTGLKMLVELGLPYTHLITITNRSHGTISNVRKSASWADYRARIKANTERARRGKVQFQPEVTLEAPLEAIVDAPQKEQVATLDAATTSELIVALTELRSSIKELSGALEVKDTWTKRLLGN